MGVAYEDGRSLTYREWEDKSQLAAGVLIGLGVQVGDRVALYLQNSLELVTLIFGCWKIGAVPVTLSVMYNANELKTSLDKTSSVCLVTHGSKQRMIDELPNGSWSNRVLFTKETDGEQIEVPLGEGRQILEQALAKVSPIQTIYRPREDDEGTILFTGGTTGLPKAVTVTHAGTRNSLRTLARVSKRGAEGPYEAAPESVSPNLLALPLFHSGGQQALLFALHVGRSIVIMERFRVATLGRLVDQYSIDNLFLMPTMLYDIVHAKERFELRSLRSVLVAGQELDPTLKQAFESGWGVPILSNYGSTEIGHVAGWTSKDLKLGRWKAGPVGRIYDGVEIEIRDESGAAQPRGIHGEIWVKNGNTKGYVEGSEVVAGSLVVEGWVASGDIGYVEGDNYLYLVGRKRDMIKTGGFQVWPQEIEQILRKHPLVADVAVVGMNDARLGEVPGAFVVTSETVDHEDLERRLIEFCREQLSHFKCIRHVTVLDELPRSEAGKVQRGELQARIQMVSK
jgi:long-chain acyl-CoA synthetase